MPIHFNHHSQGEEEPVEQYITSLYSLAKECQSEKLQIDLDLTLEKVKSIVRHREAVHEQQATLQETEETSLLDLIGRKPTPSKTKGSEQARPDLDQIFGV